MAKNRREIENPILTLIEPHKRYREPNPKQENICKCGCKKEIAPGFDSYIIIDDMMFWSDECVTDYFIKEAGGRRVYGGAC